MTPPATVAPVSASMIGSAPVGWLSAEVSNGDRTAERDRGDGDIVDAALSPKAAQSKSPDEQRLIDGRDGARSVAGAQEIAGGGIEQCLPQPHDAGLELCGDGRRVIGQEEWRRARRRYRCRAAGRQLGPASRLKSRSMVAMRRTCALWPLNASVTRSPTLMSPRRRSRRDREVEAAAGRSARAAERPRGSDDVAEDASEVLQADMRPVYQGMCSDLRATLSPPTGETGMAIASRKPKRSVSSRKSASMARNFPATSRRDPSC